MSDVDQRGAHLKLVVGYSVTGLRYCNYYCFARLLECLRYECPECDAC